MVSIDSIMNARPAVLVLKCGKIFRGTGFGTTKRVVGECVFYTNAGAGYDALLTDSNTAGTIPIFAYPLIGNYGVASWEKDQYGLLKCFESDSIKPQGIVAHEFCRDPSHFECTQTFEDFMKEGNLPGLESVDTRDLTHILRDQGAQMGILEIFDSAEKIPSDDELRKAVATVEDINVRNFSAENSRKSTEIFCPEKPVATVVAIDCGIKNSIIRNLVLRNLKVVVVPYNTSAAQILEYHPKGILISNGPGNPILCTETITTVKALLAKKIPIMGIDLGNLILGLAIGAQTYKMKSGHHGSSKPVVDQLGGRVYMTGQYHRYAIDTTSLKGTGFQPLFTHLDDQSCEGIYHPTEPFFGVQFPPGPYPAPEDTNFLYDRFLKNMGLGA
jgi:carbamoyl-phosphate synthase small subunit